MGSMPCREAAERRIRERATLQPALECRACGALTPGTGFRYFGDRLICGACDHQNLQSRVRSIPRELLAPRTICLNFVPGDRYTIQAMHLDHRTMLGPRVKVQSAETLRKLLAYLAPRRAVRRIRRLPSALGSGHNTDRAGTWEKEPAAVA
jgi:hypothetical protein